MFYTFRYNNGGIPHGLIKFHDSFIKEMVKCFEKGKEVKKHSKEARKAVKKALKIAKKERRKPAAMISRATGSVNRVSEEIEYARRVLWTTYKNMEAALREIEKEKVEDVIGSFENARESFEKRNFKKGGNQLRESMEKLKKKRLLKTRTALFCGVSSEVDNLKREFYGRKRTASPGQNALK